MSLVMEMTTTKFNISPVNMEQRRNLDIRSGDTARVHIKIQEKGKTRIQVFEGLVLAVKHGKETGGSFTVRKTASGVGVEKIFPIYSPIIDKIEIVKRSKVRQSKLYYIREKVAREIRRKMRNMKMVSITTDKKEDDKVETEADAATDKTEENVDTLPETPKEEVKTDPETVKEKAKEEVVVEEKETEKVAEEKASEVDDSKDKE